MNLVMRYKKPGLLFLTGLIMSITLACNKDRISDDEKIRNYLFENGIDAQKHESGIYYLILKEGVGGEYPESNSNVKVLYKGYLLDGRVFDQTVTQQSVSFNLQGVIKGWQIGIQLMEKKSKASFFIPSHLGYGSYSPSSSIPRDAVLIFDVELVDFD